MKKWKIQQKEIFIGDNKWKMKTTNGKLVWVKSDIEIFIEKLKWVNYFMINKLMKYFEKGYGTFWCGFMFMLLSSKEAMEYIGLKGMKVLGCMGFGVPAVTYHNVAPRKDESVLFIE